MLLTCNNNCSTEQEQYDIGNIRDTGFGSKVIVLFYVSNLTAVKAPYDVSGIYKGKKVPSSWLPGVKQRLIEFSKLPNDWNGYGSPAPNNKAILNTENVLDVLHEVSFAPTQISPSAEGGIAISFTKENKYAFIECDNDGDILVATSNRRGKRDIRSVEGSEEAIKGAVDAMQLFMDV